MRIPFDRVADIYDKTRGLPPKVMKKIVQVLIKELKEYKTVLDIGVGTGRFAKPLQQNGFEVVGIDISTDMMQNAKQKGVNNLLLGDACFLPFKDSSFDAALSVHVLHLISDWQTALKEICRVTEEGLFSVATSPSRSPVSDAYEKLAKEKGYKAGYIGLSERQLKEIVKPTKSMQAAFMVSSADEHLAYLGQRAYSRQWKVPEEVDKQIVKELVRRFAGQKYTVEMHIVRWNIKDLKSYFKGCFK
jgi:ubiquinone/menaquinone biosynthesis C-methylase UbiE